jgi:uncharacterized radical SAM superfamily Fe-S cluster-containing enzyme
MTSTSEIPAISWKSGGVADAQKCPKHGKFEASLYRSSVPAAHRELVSRARFSAETHQRNHVLHDQIWPWRCTTVDLTNRCNMMCDPCFMDSTKSVTFTARWHDIQKILDDA